MAWSAGQAAQSEWGLPRKGVQGKQDNITATPSQAQRVQLPPSWNPQSLLKTHSSSASPKPQPASSMDEAGKYVKIVCQAVFSLCLNKSNCVYLRYAA